MHGIYIYAYMHGIYKYTHTCTHIYIYIYLHIHATVYIYKYMHVCVYIIYICKYIYKHYITLHCIALNCITLHYITLQRIFACVVYQSLAGCSASAQSSGAICGEKGRNGVMSFPHRFVDWKDGLPPFNNIQQPINDNIEYMLFQTVPNPSLLLF